MPCKVDKIKIEKTNLDRRRKLDNEQKKQIKKLCKKKTIAEVARMFNVSRRTIQFIINPEALKRNKELRQERGGWLQYYNKEKHREAMKNTRDYKKELENNEEI